MDKAKSAAIKGSRRGCETSNAVPTAQPELGAGVRPLDERRRRDGRGPRGVPAALETMGRREVILNPRAWLLRVRGTWRKTTPRAFRRNGTHPPQTMNGVQGREPLPLDNLEKEETFGRCVNCWRKCRRPTVKS